MAESSSLILCPRATSATAHSSQSYFSSGAIAHSSQSYFSSGGNGGGGLLMSARKTRNSRGALRKLSLGVFDRRTAVAVGNLRWKPVLGYDQLVRPHRFMLAATLGEDSGFLGSKAEDLKKQAEKSKEVLNEALNKLKDGALKLQDITKSTYEESTEKTLEILQETTEQLKKQSEIVMEALAATAQETTEKGKENLSLLAENAPDPIKDVASTALDAHFQEKERKDSKIHDFCLGIPFGALLVVGGLLGFLVFESTAALRFGVMLGGLHLFLSIKSLKSWKEGSSTLHYMKGQAAITLILFLREFRKLLETKLLLPHALFSVMTAAMVGFYIYVYSSEGKTPEKSTSVESA